MPGKSSIVTPINMVRMPWPGRNNIKKPANRKMAPATPKAEAIKAKVTRWIHPEAVFMLHGYGATVPLATGALGVGVADQRLQHGKLYDFDPAGSGCALTETVVRIKPAAAGGATS